MSSKINYSEAFEELQQIISEMENSEIDIDMLDAKVKRASVLLKICKDKLFKAEENVMSTLKAMEQ